MKLFTRYLNSAAYYDRENEGGSEKTPAQIEREKIASNNTTVGTRSDNEEKEVKEGEDENKNSEGGENVNEGDDEDDGEKEEENEEDDEQKKIKAKEERKQNRIQKRIDKLVAENNLTKQENANLKKQLEANPDKTLTEEEVQRRAKELADNILKDRQTKDAQKQFEKDCDDLRNQAVKVNDKFDTIIKEMAEEVSPIPGQMIGILADLDNKNGGEVLNYLAENIEEYEEFFSGTDDNGDMIALSEGRMTAKLIRLSDKIKKTSDENKNKNKKQISKVPDPISPLNTGRDAKSVNVLPQNPTKNMDEYVRIRNLQDAERRKARGGR